MKRKADFVVVGSGGGGGTIAWLLAKAGFEVMLLEQGPDFAKPVVDGKKDYNPVTHDEYFYRNKRPDPKRRPRGDYNTIRRTADEIAKPFIGGWTGSVLGGGSILWGTWAFRALPIDFKLNTLFTDLKQISELNGWGYAVPDWPIAYAELEPFYNVAEALLAVCGDRQSLVDSIKSSPWYEAFSGKPYFGTPAQWEPKLEFPVPPYPRTPVGQFVFEALDKAGMRALTLPTAIVTPGSGTYKTREAIARALANWDGENTTDFWKKSAEKLWSERVRSACNMCGFCGEYLCWGRDGPKSGTRVSTLKELQDLEANGKAKIVCNAKVFEVLYDTKTKLASGVRYLDVSDPDNPTVAEQHAKFIIISCGAVQTARLLFLSGPPGGLGNSADQLGRYATFHQFGLSAKITLTKEFQGLLHGEFGHTGNTTTFAPYFIQDPVSKKWLKAGTLTSTAKKNPLGDGAPIVESKIGLPLLTALETNARSLEVRLTADDLPMTRTRVDLDPRYVDEYGFPVARITRELGPHEWQMFTLIEAEMARVFEPFKKSGAIESLAINPAILNLVGDHQMGTCRMGDDPKSSVVDRNCRLHDAKNVFVVDSSFMPTGFGLNPMVTVVANALRVGTYIADTLKRGGTP